MQGDEPVRAEPPELLYRRGGLRIVDRDDAGVAAQPARIQAIGIAWLGSPVPFG